MIRVLHSVSNMDRAGIETMLMNYYRNIDRTQIQFDFLCNKMKPGDYDEEIRALGGRIFHTPGLNPLKYPLYLKCMKKLFRENPEYQIVEAHNGALGVYALLAAKVNNIPVRIFHAHGASIGKDWKLPLKLLCKALLPMSMNQHFTCGVAAAKCYFPTKVIENQQYQYIPNAIDIDQFCFDDSVRIRIREENGLTDKHVIGHVGRFSVEKNHKFLLEVFQSLKVIDPLAHLVLIGEGELQESVKEETARLGLSDCVHFLGSIKNVNEWYQAFDVFVLPSFREGLPVVGVEAQAADLPCVFADSVTREIGLLDKTIFLGLDEGSKRWAEVIFDRILSDNRKNIRTVIAEHGFDIAVEAKKLQEQYLLLVGVHQ